MKVYKKNSELTIRGIAMMLSCTMLLSCNNEDFFDMNRPGKAYDNICFGISSDENVQTRGVVGSDENSCTDDGFVLRSEDPADTLCVSTFVLDGISSSCFNGGQTLTRGVPVTTESFYDTFHVLAYWHYKGVFNDSYFFMNEVATDDGTNLWHTSNTYYWPGAEHTLQFYAWAPANANDLVHPSSPQSKVLGYTVPESAPEQKDIVVANTEEIQGDSGTTVPLTFKHICTAVRFAVGSQMQPGSIKSVALKGVKNAGTYDMVTGSWALGETITDFSQELNKSLNGSETNGTEITTAEGSFMMLPQILSTGAMVEVVFTDLNNKEHIYRASVAGKDWPMGKTVTYKISISPEYELEFVSEPQIQDAHYVICPIIVRAGNLQGKSWTVETDGSDWVDLKWESELIDLEKDGFWIDNSDTNYDNKRAAIIGNTAGTAGDFVLYAFLKENITGSDRSTKLSVKVDGMVADIFTINQKCPLITSGGKYVELFDDRIPEGTNLTDDTKPVPWGFSWTNLNNIEYQYNGGSGNKIPPGHWNDLTEAISLLDIDPKFITIPEKNHPGNIVINLDQFGLGTDGTPIAISEGEGMQNTRELYDFGGISDLQNIIQLLNSISDLSLTSDSPDIENPDEFASYCALKKNMFNLEKKQISLPDGNIMYIFTPVIKDENFKWYLPAVNEYFAILSNEYPLVGTYWTSTGIYDNNDRSKAYIYTPNQSIIKARGESHKIRAMRAND